jgi:hypothetical protein
VKKPRGPRTRQLHEQQDAELARLHRVCRELAIEDAERERVMNEEINVLLRQASQEERPVWRR